MPITRYNQRPCEETFVEGQRIFFCLETDGSGFWQMMVITVQGEVIWEGEFEAVTTSTEKFAAEGTYSRTGGSLNHRFWAIDFNCPSESSASSASSVSSLSSLSSPSSPSSFSSVSSASTLSSGSSRSSASSASSSSSSGLPPGPPFVQSISDPSTTAPAATSFTVTVIYADDTQVNAATVGIGDLVITKIGLTLVPSSVSVGASGPTVTAVYTFAAPGGHWSASGNNGTWTITVGTGVITDNLGLGNATASHTFVVNN